MTTTSPQAGNTHITSVRKLAIDGTRKNYIFFWNDEQQDEFFRTLGRFASNPELSFTWSDAAIVAKKVEQLQLAHS